MSDVDRYARQRSTEGVGEAGQAKIRAAAIALDGVGLDAEIAAFYLAGAGVGRLEVAAGLADGCRAHNGEVDVVVGAGAGRELVVRVADASYAADASRDPDPVTRGSRAARWALARILSA